MRIFFGPAGQARILFEDWDRANALTLSAMTERTGYEVATGFNGEEAVVKAANLTPDLSITKPLMGRLSGLEAATAIAAVHPPSGPCFSRPMRQGPTFRRVLL
jgi:CheY-like chemotaxis protein